MDKALFDQYLKERYEDQLDWYDRKADAAKFKYNSIQTLAIVFAALTTVVAAIAAAGGMAGKVGLWTAAGISALVTVLSSLLHAFKHKETWLSYRATYDALKREKYYYQAQVADYRDAADLESLFVQRVEGIMAHESAVWLSMQRRKDEASKQKSVPAQ